MSEYQFENLVKDLSCNREIEFEYNAIRYSITNAEKYWYLSNDSEHKSIKICKFDDGKILIDIMRNLVIENTSICLIICGIALVKWNQKNKLVIYTGVLIMFFAVLLLTLKILD